MGNLTPFGLSPFDILIKDFFNSDTEFRPAHQTKINHPVDIYEADDGLNIDIACVGLTKKDIDITVEGDILKVEYNRDKSKKDESYELDDTPKSLVDENTFYGLCLDEDNQDELTEERVTNWVSKIKNEF